MHSNSQLETAGISKLNICCFAILCLPLVYYIDNIQKIKDNIK
jgi:hypothetical protein